MKQGRDPPPRDALRCPRGGHTEIGVRRKWFYCAGCGRDGDGRYDRVVDARRNRLIDHAEFVARWGHHVYRGRSI